MIRRKIALLLAGAVALLGLAACVDQHPESAAAASAAPAGSSDAPRVVATSVASVEIMEKLDVDLVGVPSSTLATTPKRYKDATVVGTPMAPDIEVLQSLGPDWVFSPNSLQADLEPKYEAAGLNALFLDLRSVEGMYRSIEELGGLLDRQAEAQALVGEYEAFYSGYQSRNEGREAPRVLVLMGLPGSYIVATEHAYVGSLVKMAGGVNVYEGESEEFIAANTEDMLGREPDIILRAAHAMPEDVTEMFAEEFAENDIWKHFAAVQNGAVYDLPYEEFGMSAKFNYPDALETLEPLLYGNAA